MWKIIIYRPVCKIQFIYYVLEHPRFRIEWKQNLDGLGCIWKDYDIEDRDDDIKNEDDENKNEDDDNQDGNDD